MLSLKEIKLKDKMHAARFEAHTFAHRLFFQKCLFILMLMSWVVSCEHAKTMYIKLKRKKWRKIIFIVLVRNLSFFYRQFFFQIHSIISAFISVHLFAGNLSTIGIDDCCLDEASFHLFICEFEKYKLIFY